MPQMTIPLLNLFASPYEIITIKWTIFVIKISILTSKLVKSVIHIIIWYAMKQWFDNIVFPVSYGFNQNPPKHLYKFVVQQTDFILLHNNQRWCVFSFYPVTSDERNHTFRSITVTNFTIVCTQIISIILFIFRYLPYVW